MPLDLTDVQQFVSDSTLILGKALMYTGGAGLFVMAVVGTAAIDLVLLVYATENHNNFLTAMIFMSMFFRNDSEASPWPALLASPITSAIAIALSVILGVSHVGAAIAAGWAITAAITLIGYALVEFAKYIEPEVDAVNQTYFAETNRYDPECDSDDEFEDTYTSSMPTYGF